MSPFILALGAALSAWFSERPKAQLTPEVLDKILNLAMTEGGFTAALRMLNALGGAEHFEGVFEGLNLSFDDVRFESGRMKEKLSQTDKPRYPSWLWPISLDVANPSGTLSLMKGDPLLLLLWMANARRLDGLLRSAWEVRGQSRLQSTLNRMDPGLDIGSSFTQENFGVFEKGIPSEMRLRRAVMRLGFVTLAGYDPANWDYDEILDLAASPRDGSEPWVSELDLEEFLESHWLTRDSGWAVLKEYAETYP